MSENSTHWRKCSTCKKDILLNAKYFECSVSTCTGQRTGYVFCTLSCWEVHLPGAKHRNAGAVEKKAPYSAELQTSSSLSSATETAQRRILVSSAPSQTVIKSTMSQEVLVVVSKMKQYIRDVSQMNTSEDVNQVLSDFIRVKCDQAIDHARADGRKTVMARDFK